MSVLSRVDAGGQVEAPPSAAAATAATASGINPVSRDHTADCWLISYECQKNIQNSTAKSGVNWFGGVCACKCVVKTEISCGGQCDFLPWYQ